MDLADQFMQLDEKIRSGTLRMFGCWFGRPMDNMHRSVSASFENRCLTIRFHRDETLEVWDPSELRTQGGLFQIPRASRVRWTWYHYGSARTPENLRFNDYVVEDGVVSRTTKFGRAHGASIDEPAVELHY